MLPSLKEEVSTLGGKCDTLDGDDVDDPLETWDNNDACFNVEEEEDEEEEVREEESKVDLVDAGVGSSAANWENGAAPIVLKAVGVVVLTVSSSTIADAAAAAIAETVVAAVVVAVVVIVEDAGAGLVKGTSAFPSPDPPGRKRQE